MVRAPRRQGSARCCGQRGMQYSPLGRSGLLSCGGTRAGHGAGGSLGRLVRQLCPGRMGHHQWLRGQRVLRGGVRRIWRRLYRIHGRIMLISIHAGWYLRGLRVEIAIVLFMRLGSHRCRGTGLGGVVDGRIWPRHLSGGRHDFRGAWFFN